MSNLWILTRERSQVTTNTFPSQVMQSTCLQFTPHPSRRSSSLTVTTWRFVILHSYLTAPHIGKWQHIFLL